MPPSRQSLITTSDVRAWRVPHASATCVVTFGNLVDVPMADQSGFGETFFDAERVDAVHVRSAGNDWYQYAEMPEVLARIREAIGPGKRILTYGSSMGGYAALRFSGTLGAAGAIAISPQFTLDRRIVPFERRWLREARRIVFTPMPADEVRPPATIIYDPRNPDRRHADLWAAAGPVTRVPLPFAGHPAATFLAETGLLSATVRDLVAGRFEPAALLREAHSRRRRSGKYLMTIASAQPPSRRRWTIPLTRLAVEANPTSTDYMGRLAILLYLAGEYSESEEWHRRAVALDPGDHACLFRYSRFLQRLRRFDEALDLARRAAEAHPGSEALRRHLRTLERQAGPPDIARLMLSLRNVALHRYTKQAWSKGWPLIDRLGRP